MDYEIAKIPESCLKEISKLENQIKQQTGEEIVLVAYEPNHK